MKNAEVNKSLTVNSEGNITPTLFIGVGGTGAEVLLNLRRNMLSHVWSGGEEVQLSTLSEFPYAEFLCIDLDFSAFRESSKPDRDSLHVQAYFSPNETISKRLDLFKYLGSEERLRSFPLVEEWFPLILRNNEGYERFFNGSPRQIRSISRLYFYDHFWEIKSSIEQSLSNLRNNAVRSDKHSQLRLKPEAEALRVVVVASTAGGTGSGAFIDIGYLSQILLSKCGVESTCVTSILILPTGFMGSNSVRSQANSYAALMELETCMLGRSSHVSSWDGSEEFSPMPARPYDDIYLLDTENVVSLKTENVQDSFKMAADVLFEDLLVSRFSQRKRFVPVNQRQHKIFPYRSKVGQELFGKDFSYAFTRSYSSFGHSALDMQLQRKQMNVVENQVARLLGVIFGLGAEGDSFYCSRSSGASIGEVFNVDLERGRKSAQLLIENIKKRIEFNEAAMKRSSAMFQVLPEPGGAVDELKNLIETELRSLEFEVFESLGEDRDLYKKIESPEGGVELCAKLRHQVIAKIKQCEQEWKLRKDVNPLFAALDALTPDNCKSVLSQTMQRAMPWIAIKPDSYLKEEKPEEQYTCLIGVKDHAEFKRRYGDALLACVPPSSKMTATQVDFFEINEPGKLICYVELSGVPIPAISALADWHAAYKVEDKKIPVHVHKQVSKFVHVIEMNEAELASRYSDFELMLQALALCDLARSPRRSENGRLRMKWNEGERSVGDERVIRLNGFEHEHRVALQEKIENSLSLLKNPQQKEMWYLLMLYYLERVYPIWENTNEDNTTRVEKHLPTLVCENLLAEARQALIRLGRAEAEIDQLKKKSAELLPRFSEEIQGSEADPYPHEVGGPEGAKLLPKRALKLEVLEEHWSYATAQPVQASPAAGAVSAPSMPPLAASSPQMPPPLVPPSTLWHLNVNGVNYGPFAQAVLQTMIPTGQLTAQTMVWREGLSAWLPACTMPELAALFAPPPVPPTMPSAAMPPPVSVPPPRMPPTAN